MPSGTNSKWLILAASTKKIVILKCDFCNLSSAGENSFNTIPCCVVSFHFISGLNWKHQLSSPVTILCKMSWSWSTILTELREHSTWCSLCSALKECATNQKQIFFFSKSLSKICLATSLPTLGCAANSLVVIRLSSITRVRLFTFSWFEQKLGVLDEDHPPAIPCLLENTQTIRKLVHNLVISVHIFQVMVHLYGSFPSG